MKRFPLISQELWLQWVQALPKLQGISIPRWFGVCKDDSHLELHCFSDASSVDYGAVCYLRVVRGTSRECKFILGKSRVSPIKTVTIPRLELSAATLAIKLARIISKELEVEFDSVELFTGLILRQCDGTSKIDLIVLVYLWRIACLVSTVVLRHPNGDTLNLKETPQILLQEVQCQTKIVAFGSGDQNFCGKQKNIGLHDLLTCHRLMMMTMRLKR